MVFQLALKKKFDFQKRKREKREERTIIPTASCRLPVITTITVITKVVVAAATTAIVTIRRAAETGAEREAPTTRARSE